MIFKRHTFISAEHCNTCRHYAENEHYRELVAAFGKGAAAVPENHQVPRAFPTCKFLGEEIGPLDRERRGLSHIKIWHLCMAGLGDPPGCVCLCVSCGPKCSGYSAESEEKSTG